MYIWPTGMRRPFGSSNRRLQIWNCDFTMITCLNFMFFVKFWNIMGKNLKICYDCGVEIWKFAMVTGGSQENFQYLLWLRVYFFEKMLWLRVDFLLFCYDYEYRFETVRPHHLRTNHTNYLQSGKFRSTDSEHICLGSCQMPCAPDSY
jgi:hypothetical protein